MKMYSYNCAGSNYPLKIIKTNNVKNQPFSHRKLSVSYQCTIREKNKNGF